MSQKGLRYNQGKPKLSLVLEARLALIGWARALEYGLKKYFRGNWRMGLNHTEVADSALRHLSLHLAGEDIDEESGLPHVDLALCNAGFLSEMYHARKDLDDRPIIAGKLVEKPKPKKSKPKAKSKKIGSVHV